MMYREIIAVFSENHSKHVHTLNGQKTEFMVVHEEAVRLYKVR
jgi:hypothetical protein